MMLRLTTDTKIDIMRADNRPAATCNDGDTVVFETLDCYDGIFHHDGSKEDRSRMHNPATGPLYVNGAARGDALRVEILKIATRSWGAMGTYFGSGAFKSIEGPEDKKMYIYDIRDGKLNVGGVELETKNMIGVIGVAPADKEGVLTVTPGSHGGNMDCTRITEGSTILFPVEAPGALLAMGDLHAVMGDGEVFGYGMEVSGEVTVRVSVIKNANIEQPTLIEGGDVMTVASGETLERATENALTSMYHLVEATGMDRSQAGILMSCRCDLAICEIVNPLYTVRATMPRSMVKIPE